METKKRIVLQPDYMKKFSCIGTGCEDSCCAGWSIEIDKAKYLMYKKIQNKELKPLFNKMISRKHNQKSDDSYAKIKMSETGKCPFLDEKSLCKIHGTIGEEYLSDTCSTYPRLLRIVDGKYERSATMSCPEIARLALLNPDGLCFENIEEDSDLRIKVNSIFSTLGQSNSNKLELPFWDIRLFSLCLLQNRNFNMGERLTILGLTYKKIDELRQSKNMINISTILEDRNKSIENGEFKKYFDKIHVNSQIQMRLVKEMMDKKMTQGILSERYKKCFNEALAGLGFVNEDTIESILQKYEYNYKEFVAPYLKDKDYILENYIVNEYFRNLMPLGDYNSMWDSYILLCVLYSMVKFHMIGIGGYNQGLTDELVVELIQCFSKVVLHSTSYIKGILKLLKENNYDTLAYMSILINN